MPSPFPGMDPYLEQYWRDIHARCIIYAADQLQGRLPADLRVVERGRGRAAMPDVEPALAMSEPLILYVPDTPVTERYIDIIDVGSGRRVVTTLEILNLSNKTPGEAQALYLRKQRELKDGQVNLVEIDLLRAGERVLSVGASRIPASHQTLYQVCIYRAATALPCHEIYRVPLCERLPVIRIPLRATDPDIALDLQAIIDQCYRNGGYDEDIDYGVAPDPPLDTADTLWADALLRRAGRR